MTSIADTIRSLKPGDRVRVTFEDEVHMQYSGGIALISADVNEDVITSIEVIERPLHVGDRVQLPDRPRPYRGTITGLGKDKALVLWDDNGCEEAAWYQNLRRAS